MASSLSEVSNPFEENFCLHLQGIITSQDYNIRNNCRKNLMSDCQTFYSLSEKISASIFRAEITPEDYKRHTNRRNNLKPHSVKKKFWKKINRLFSFDTTRTA
jgi:hypothetical protein